MKTRARLRSLVLDVTPPALLELARAVRARTPFAPRVVPPGVRPASWYDAAYAATDEYRRHYTESQYYFLWSVLADRMLQDPPASVLDLGCGPGQFAELLRDKGLPRYRGVDLSEPAIALARQRCPGYAFETADLVASPLLGQGGPAAVSLPAFADFVGRNPPPPAHLAVKGFSYVALGWLLASYLAGPVLKGDAGAAAAKSAYQNFLVTFSLAKTSDANQRKVRPEHSPAWIARR